MFVHVLSYRQILVNKLCAVAYRPTHCRDNLQLPGTAWDSVAKHDIETSSEWSHEWTPQPRCEHDQRSVSVPLQRTLSSHMRPVPGPNTLDRNFPARLQQHKQWAKWQSGIKHQLQRICNTR